MISNQCYWRKLIDDLNQVEKRIYINLMEPKSLMNLFNEVEFDDVAKSFVSDTIIMLEKRELIKDLNKNAAICNVKRAVAVLGLLPGVLRLMSGITNGKPVGLLIFELILAGIYLVAQAVEAGIYVTKKGQSCQKAYESTFNMDLVNKIDIKDDTARMSNGELLITVLFNITMAYNKQMQ